MQLARGKKRLKQRAANFCWMRSNLLATTDVMERQTTAVHSSLDLTLTIYRYLRDEKMKALLPTRQKNLIPRSLMESERVMKD
jgi:hypothetical protein